MTLGENIRQIRKNKGMSIQQIRDITGLSKSTISEIENDISNPTISTLTKISHALNVSLDKLLVSESANLETIKAWDK
jgi:transcriptional regulator with XRE-family HTH domain